MKLAVGIIFNGINKMHGRLLRSLEVATKCVEEAGIGHVQLFGKIVGNAGAVQSERNISFLKGTTNSGFGASHNEMMRNAFSDDTNDIYLCLNDDTVLAPDALKVAIEYYISQNRLLLIEAMQIPSEHPKPYDPLTGETAWCSGAALFIPKTIFNSTGGFDENLFMYCEDVDLSWRARLHGATCHVLPSCRVFHSVEPQGDKPWAIKRQMLISARYLGFKWGAHDFQRHFEGLLVERGYYPALEYIPAIPKSVQTFPAPLDFCEFRQELSFAIPRWK
jgi:N-acetylglucosaminyl-diphospho-decaprenol L-rhamnosyltransferase